MLEPNRISRILSMLPGPESMGVSGAAPSFEKTAFIEVPPSQALQIFYENHFVALGAVDQFVGEAFRHQQSEASWPDAHLVAQFHVAERFLGVVRNSRVGQSIHGETRAWIADVID